MLWNFGNSPSLYYCADKNLCRMERNEKGQFVKGRTETIEEKLKRIQASKEAWKERDDYIADIVQEYPRIYSSWRAIMFTEKGKKAGHSEE